MTEQHQSEHNRIREAYLQMAEKAKFRPEAPSDGFGNIQLEEPELLDSARLAKEADAYATRFIAEENTTQFHVGVSNFTTNRALVYTIEAARLLCGGSSGDAYAQKLLEMAVEEVKSARKQAPNPSAR
jgi:hypothetical protein